MCAKVNLYVHVDNLDLQGVTKRKLEKQKEEKEASKKVYLFLSMLCFMLVAYDELKITC